MLKYAVSPTVYLRQENFHDLEHFAPENYRMKEVEDDLRFLLNVFFSAKIVCDLVTCLVGSSRLMLLRSR